MSVVLAPIESTPYIGGTATGVIYVDATGLQKTNGPQWDGTTFAVGAAGDGTGTLQSGLLDVNIPTATDVGLSIEAAAAQSANLFELTTNGGTAGDVFKVDSAGDITASGDIRITEMNKGFFAPYSYGFNVTSSTGATNTLRMYGGSGYAIINGLAGNGLKLFSANGVIIGNDTTFSGDITQTTTLSAATGNEAAHTLNYTVNKATSGDDTGLLISMTDTASPGTSLPLDIQVGGTSVLKVDSAGDITTSGDLIISSPTVPASASATGTAGTISWDSSYIYICTATNTWKRVAIATW